MFGKNVVKTLGEVCKVNQGTYIKSNMKIQGEYPVYGGGNPSYFINQYNREDDIIIAKDGVSADCVRYEKNKFFLNHHGWTIICKDVINKKYMFYYLQSIQPELLSIAKGTAQLGINQENFYKVKIPIPSVEKQKEIVHYCQSNDQLIQQLESSIQESKRIAHDYLNMALHISEEVSIEETVEPIVSALQMIEEAREEAGVREEVSTESVVDAFLQETIQEATVVIPKKKKKKVLPKSSSSE
jgi:type I restriction enzyme S subunit